jgi:ethanolamine transporter EutH
MVAGTLNLNGVKVAVAVPVRVKTVLTAVVEPMTTELASKESAEAQSVRTVDTVEPGFDEVEVGTALGF